MPICLPPVVLALSVITGQPAAPATDAGTDGGWTDVAVEFERPLFFVHLTVGSLGPEWFIVDSGAFPSILDPRVADAFPQRPSKFANAPAVAGVPLAGDGLAFEPNEFLVFEFEASISEAMGRRVSGILGADFLATRVVELDYQAGRMRTRPTEGFAARKDDLVVPLWAPDRAWATIELRPQAGESFGAWLMIDTGSNGGINLSRTLAERFGLPGESQTIFTASRASDGDWERTSIRLDSIRFGEQDIARPVLDLSPPDSRSPGILGADILEQFTVTFDLARQRMLLRPNERFGQLGEASNTGLGLVARGKDFDQIVVANIARASPAEEAGIRPGDTVVTVDGRPAEEYGLQPLTRYLQGSVGRSVTLRVKRGDAELDCVLTAKQRLD